MKRAIYNGAHKSKNFIGICETNKQVNRVNGITILFYTFIQC